MLFYKNPAFLNCRQGDCVEIELKNMKIWGIISDFCDELPQELDEKKVKPILGKICSSPVFADRRETDFLKWVADYYMFPFHKLLKQIFLPMIGSDNALIGDSAPEKHLGVLCKAEKLPETELNPSQKRVVDSILERWEKKDYKPVLIYGVTGSGKSEIFAELCRDVIKKGKQILYLVPEIGLTTKSLQHLVGRVGAPGVILHSSVTKKKRFSALYCAINKHASIIVGTRSAVLYPFFDIGLIVIDEEHDGSFKNFEPPYYHARDVAVMKAAAMKIPVVMGSATPSGDSWLNALNGKYHLEIIKERANNRPLPKIETFAYRGDLYIPSDLVDIVSDSLKNGEQSLFFLNRRGFATIARCADCNEIAMCPNCKTALIYHKKKEKLICHHCGFSVSPEKCGKCGGELVFEGIGVEKLFEAIESYFPGAKALSFDKDTLGTAALFDKAVKEIAEEKCQLIVGTVMISKGHNFPKLRNVVIKFADYLLGFRDPRASEKCFQQIVQVAGRAGRFGVEGRVFAETIYPDHYIWNYIKNNDYEGFINEELSWREQLGFPPFTRMITVRISGTDEAKTDEFADKCFEIINNFVENSSFEDVLVYPPAEPMLSKVQNRFRKNISITFPKNSKVAAAIKNCLWKIEKKSGITVTYDVDPISEN
ncbi:primosomal protein N' [bacterium]|nr:primosomal protein N' [bacterium]